MSEPVVVDLVELRKVYAFLRKFIEAEERQRLKVYDRNKGAPQEKYWAGKCKETHDALLQLQRLGKALAGVYSGQVRLIDSADPAGSEYTPEYRQTEMFEPDVQRNREELGYD